MKNYRYEYNLAGQLKQITDPWNATVTYNRNEAGQEISVTGIGYKNRNQYTNLDVNTFASDIRYRAWGGIKQFTNGSLSGNNAFAMGYDARRRLTSYTGASKATEHDYYNDGLIKEVRDLHWGSDFLRKYEYDHVGRLTKSHAGGDEQTSLNPYSLTLGYDSWGNSTSRQGSHWNQPLPDFSATYVNDRDTNMAYDAAGNVKGFSGGVADPYLHYNAAGQLFAEQEDGSDAQHPVIRENYYDGNGAKVIYIPFNSSLNDGTYAQASITYLIRSSVLEGKVIAEYRDLMLPWLSEGDPLRYYSKSYVYLKGVQIAFQEFAHKATEKWVAWIHHNPVIGTLTQETQLATDSSGQLYNNESVPTFFDPIGSVLALSAGSQPIVPDALQGFAAIPFPGEPGNRCYADGILSSCGYVYAMLNSGNGEVVPPGTTRLPPKGGKDRYAPPNDPSVIIVIDWDNGYYGFVPTGAKMNKHGGSAWYDPNTGIEGILDIPIESGSQVRDPNFLKNLDLINNAHVDGQVRSAASQFFVDNGKCANAISAALFKMNTANFSPSVEDKLNQLGFIDVTQNSEIARIPAYTAFLNTSVMPGPITTGEHMARAYGHTNTLRALPSETSGRTIKRPTIFVGEFYHKQSPYQQRFIAGHESLHGVFKGDHEFIAKALGLSYAIGADDAETNFNANRVINEWLAGGCSGFRGVAPVQ